MTLRLAEGTVAWSFGSERDVGTVVTATHVHGMDATGLRAVDSRSRRARPSSPRTLGTDERLAPRAVR
ncbi:hypothetical protein ACIQK5_09005 [Streptomyces virginiae]|uniref:hypothetical protein n=1 Tax=Streptomyces virginiae TaxID=1961 RepID=UPI0038152169